MIDGERGRVVTENPRVRINKRYVRPNTHDIAIQMYSILKASWIIGPFSSPEFFLSLQIAQRHPAVNEIQPQLYRGDVGCAV